MLVVALVALHCPEVACADCAGDEVAAQQMVFVSQPAVFTSASFAVVPSPANELVCGVATGGLAFVDRVALGSRLLI